MDLFEPGSGSQVHDFNGGRLASGLFWTVPVAGEALRVSRDGRRAVLRGAPTDPAAFAGDFAAARSTGWFSGSELGFAFRSGEAGTDRGFAQLGRERNGALL